MCEEIKIIVGHKWHPAAEYIGRPSPLGNPFYLQDESQREEVINKYREWFNEKVQSSPVVHAEITRLIKQARKHKILILGCFCAPKACHGDVIKEYLEDNIDNPVYL